MMDERRGETERGKVLEEIREDEIMNTHEGVFCGWEEGHLFL